jgi:4-aminobutyrate aminotransferase
MWAVEHTGVEPDMITIAKGIASGMPLSVLMTKAEIMDWVPGSHASTFGGNPVAIAAALATLDILEREGIKNADEVGKHIMKRIESWPAKHKLVGDVRGRGLMIGIDLVKDKQTRAHAGAERDKVTDLAFEKGLLILGAGASAIRLCPPLIITKEQADIALDIIEECLVEVQK